MSAEVQQQSARAVFRMNPDFWQQARGPPSLPPPPNLGQSSAAVAAAAATAAAAGTASGNGAAAGAGTGAGTGAGAGVASAAGNGGAPVVNTAPNNQLVSVNTGGGPSSPDSKMMTEKLVNELQVGSRRVLFKSWRQGGAGNRGSSTTAVRRRMIKRWVGVKGDGSLSSAT